MHKLVNKKNDVQKSIKEYNKIKNKICIIRYCGGYGDILISRMIFEDLKKQYPEFFITYAVPNYYLSLAKNHPYIDEAIDINNFDKDNYNIFCNITHQCLRYEIAENVNCDKNRSDIWAESFGLKLTNHNMHLPKLEKNKDYVYYQLKKHGYKTGQKIIVFTPYSAVPSRHLIGKHRKIIEDIIAKTNAFCFYLHNIPVIDELKIPSIIGQGIIDAMNYVYFSDAVITTDTGHLHCAGGYEKNILGFFNYADGNLVGKYYKNLTIVQKNKNNDPDWSCGPCNNIGGCPHPVIDNTLKCYRDLPDEMVEYKTIEFVNKLNV